MAASTDAGGAGRGHWHLTLALAAAAALLASCGLSAEEDARREVLRRAADVARESQSWSAQYDTRGGEGEDWPSNEQVVGHIAETSEGDVLRSSVHSPDNRGVGILAVVEVAMTGTGKGLTWDAGEGEAFTICVRFQLLRDTTGPRTVTYSDFDCPKQVAPRPTGN